MKSYNECANFDQLLHCVRCLQRAEKEGVATNGCRCPGVDAMLADYKRRQGRRQFVCQSVQIAVFSLLMGAFTYMFGWAWDKTDLIWGYITPEQFYGRHLVAVAAEYRHPEALSITTDDGSFWKVIPVPNQQPDPKRLTFQTEPGFCWQVIRIMASDDQSALVDPNQAQVRTL